MCGFGTYIFCCCFGAVLFGLGVLVLNGVVGKSVAFPDAVKKSGTLRHKGDEQQTIGDVTGLGVLVLNGVVGKSVAFPDAVKKSGTLRHKGDEQQTIGDVTGGRFTDFRGDRVHWNSITGLFSISGLKVDDSGMYTLLNNDAERSKENQYQLNVDASSSSALTLSVSLGQSVTLLCEGAANGPIEWRFKQQQQDQWQSVVALQDGGVSPGPGFKERVKFVRTENLRNCSITLGPVVFTDGGVYECKALHPDRIFSDVRLEVLGLGVLVLNGVVGKSVAFPAAVKKSGTLRHKGDEPHTIGDVTGGRFTDLREGRVQWNSATGLFSISGLKVDDSGMYTLLNNDERSKEYQYQLNVDDSSLSGGAVAGIVVGLLLFVAAIITMIIAMRKIQRMPGWRAIFSGAMRKMTTTAAGRTRCFLMTRLSPNPDLSLKPSLLSQMPFSQELTTGGIPTTYLATLPAEGRGAAQT
ncbi:hypothetical protein AAFF_G00433700 [Aldrovandia affinis]|uniref:Ig-like domain-containing protein n=1 Tax=Aldrovandia affinis TaxID=143900 RepID=A0AAD7VYD7_9TELE|nr:hypothetical protein AAFF_G00433700 [Aldrovandia affinis]